eukprot:scaffold330_cov246-Pinguiococcus_pyrenoidosus.AAC.13
MEAHLGLFLFRERVVDLPKVVPVDPKLATRPLRLRIRVLAFCLPRNQSCPSFCVQSTSAIGHGGLRLAGAKAVAAVVLDRMIQNRRHELVLEERYRELRHEGGGRDQQHDHPEDAQLQHLVGDVVEVRRQIDHQRVHGEEEEPQSNREHKGSHDPVVPGVRDGRRRQEHAEQQSGVDGGAVDPDALRLSVASPDVVGEEVYSKGEQKDDERDPDGFNDPPHSGPRVHVHVVPPDEVQELQLQDRPLLDVLVEETKDQGREAQEEVVPGVDVGLEDRVPREARQELVVEQNEGEHDVLVEAVEDGLREPPVVPPPVHERERAEEAELRNREVRSIHRLAAFFPRDAHPDLRGLDHPHVVRAVADGERDDHLAEAGQVQEAVLKLEVPEDDRETRTIHHQGQVVTRHAVQIEHGLLLALSLLLLFDVCFPRSGRLVGLAPTFAATADCRNAIADAVAHAPPYPGASTSQLREVRDQALELRLRRGGAAVLVMLQLDDGHVRVEQASGEADVDRRLHLVSRKHPELHARFGKIRDAGRHTFLQLVFDGGGANDQELLLHLRRGLGLQVLSAGDGDARLVPQLRPLVVLRGGHLSLCQHQRAEAVGGEDVQMLQKQLFRVTGHEARHASFLVALRIQEDRIGALAHDHDTPVGRSDNHRHPLARAVERDGGQELVLPFLSERVHQDRRAPSTAEANSQIPRAADQRLLVGALGLQGFLAVVVLLQDDGVRRRHDEQKLILGTPVIAPGSGHHLVGLHPGSGGLGGSNVLWQIRGLLVLRRGSVEPARNGAAPKLHHVPRQGPRLVREDVLDHSQVSAGRGVAAERRRVRLFVVHVQIPVQEERLRGENKFDGHVEGDGNEVVVQDDEREELPDLMWIRGVVAVVHKERQRRVLSRLAEIPRVVLEQRLPDHERDRGDGRQNRLGKEDDPHHRVGDALHLAELRRRVAGIHHDLRLPARVDNDTAGPARVAHGGPAEHQVCRVDADLIPGAIVQGHVALKVVNVRTGVLALAYAADVCHALQRLESRADAIVPRGGALAALEVGLPVDVAGLHVAHVRRVRRRQNHHVGGDLLPVMNDQKVAHIHVDPALRRGGSAAAVS